MAKYNFKCNKCGYLEELNIAMNKFVQLKKESFFDERKCENCNQTSSFTQIFGALSSKISKDRQQIVAEIQDEARKIANKVKSGDEKAIRNIYGEE